MPAEARAQPNKTGLPSVSGCDGSPAKIPLWLVGHAEEEGSGRKASTARSNATVRICFLHKLYRQLRTRNDSFPRSDALAARPITLSFGGEADMAFCGANVCF